MFSELKQKSYLCPCKGAGPAGIRLLLHFNIQYHAKHETSFHRNHGQTNRIAHWRDFIGRW